MVFLGDVAKGTAAVFVAKLLNLPDHLALLAGGAAILGHWKSVFIGFRGGDGMATLVGMTLALQPTLAPLGMAAGFAVIVLLRRYPLRSTWGIVTCFTLMLTMSLYYQSDRGLVLGLVGLAWLVLAHSTIGHRRRARIPDDEVMSLDLELESDSDLGPPAPENH